MNLECLFHIRPIFYPLGLLDLLLEDQDHGSEAILLKEKRGKM